jgi:hypothetical protein
MEKNLVIYQMSDCAVPSPLDMDDMIVKNSIKRMLSDNYTLLFVFLFITIILVLILVYFFKQIQFTLKNYKKFIGNNETINTDTDNEIIDDDNITDPSKYQDPNKTSFYKSVKDLYNEYNTEKTNYIKTTYNKENDDYINEKMEYKTYDDYIYKLTHD